MKQPFELKYIKRYLLLYVAVIITVVLFYVVNSHHNPVEVMEKKRFSTQKSVHPYGDITDENRSESPFRLLETGY